MNKYFYFVLDIIVLMNNERGDSLMVNNNSLNMTLSFFIRYNIKCCL